VLLHADGLRKWSKQERIHMEHLIVGLFLKDKGPAERVFRNAGIEDLGALTRVLAGAVDLALLEPNGYKLGTMTRLPKLSRHVEAAFRAAMAAADARRSTRIQSRHLLYGALSIVKCSVIKALSDRGVQAADVQLDDGSPPADLLTPIIGAASDRPDGADLLDLAREIDALSALVASHETRTPLSIGLFGDWGSGKSFFMQKMDEQVRRFRDAARQSPKDTPFCPNVVQLWFNAWHYMDKSLWASLLAEIFEGLANSTRQEEAGQADRKKLEETRTTLQAERTDLETERAAAQREAEASTAAAEARVQDVHRIRTSTDQDIEKHLDTKATAKELLDIVTVETAIKDDLARIARQTGLAELKTESEEAHAQIEELVGIGSYWTSVWRTASGKAGARLWLVGAGIGILLLFAGATLLAPLLHLEGAIRGATAVVTGVIGVLAPILTVARRATVVARRANVRMGERIANDRRVNLEKATREQNEAQQKAAKDRQHLESVQQKLEAIDQKLKQLQPARQLTDFVRRVHASDEYTKHFGVIARARLHFEELTRLVEAAKENPNLTIGGERLPRIDRIVLYIDDLDRCREDKVFEVLQAVHLLLAYPLFIVVVGVDPRWLLHSLRHQLGAFRDQSNQEVDGDEERIHWRSTPLNYLEKIFQIPFALRPMAHGGYGRMIDDLTASSQPLAHASSGTPSTPQGSSPPAPHRQSGQPATETGRQPETPEETAPAPQAAAQDLAGAKRVRQAHERLQLEPWERRYLKQLYPLVLTPRAAKRLVNVYRLLRAMTPGTLRLALVGDANGGGYRAVLLLLAMVTGFPAEAAVIIRRLLDEPVTDSGEDWWAFLEAFQEGAVDSEMTGEPDAERWRQLFDKLQRFRREAPADFTREEMATWAPLVARYSFASGRLLQDERAAPSPVDSEV
jgi:hypothetical protein